MTGRGAAVALVIKGHKFFQARRIVVTLRGPQATVAGAA
jgi:hypothetical protein